MRPLRAANGSFIAMRNDNEQINVTVLVRMAPGMGAIKPHLVGLKLRHQPLRDRPQKIVIERFHGFSLAPRRGDN
jgi:hypothetical protein